MKDMGDAKHSQNNCGVVSVVLGILSLIFMFFPIFGSLIALVGLVFAIMQYRYSKNSWSTAGFWLNGIGLVGGVISSVMFFRWVAEIGRQIQQASLAQGQVI